MNSLLKYINELGRCIDKYYGFQIKVCSFSEILGKESVCPLAGLGYVPAVRYPILLGY